MEFTVEELLTIKELLESKIESNKTFEKIANKINDGSIGISEIGEEEEDSRIKRVVQRAFKENTERSIRENEELSILLGKVLLVKRKAEDERVNDLIRDV